MNISRSRLASLLCATLLITSGLVAAAQEEGGSAASFAWLQRLSTASIVVESPSVVGTRLVARWKDDERELLIEGEDLTLSRTSTGVRIVSKGLVTIRWRNHTLQRWEVENMTLNIAKGSRPTISAKRLAEFR